MPPRATKSAPAPDGDDILTLLDASTGLARNVVAQWVGTDASRLSTAAVAPKSTAAAAPEVDRPARLGLGAQFLSHKQAQKLQESVVLKKIRSSTKRGLAEEDEEDDSGERVARPTQDAKKAKQAEAEPSDSESEEESRTRATSKPKAAVSTVDTSQQPKKNPGKRKRKQLQAQQAQQQQQPPHEVKAAPAPAAKAPKQPKEDDESAWSSNWDANDDDEEEEEEEATSDRIRSKPFELTQPLVPPPIAFKERIDTIDGQEVIVKRKKTKKRSKQKNLRKDTRPDALKPTYRTPGASDYRAPKPAFPHKIVVGPRAAAGADQK